MSRPYRKCSKCAGRGYNYGYGHKRTIQLTCDACKGEGYRVFKGYVWIPCSGEAHTNAHIDNCMQCAPRWGKVAVRA